MTIDAGGADSVNRDNRLINDATNVDGKCLMENP